MLMKLKKLSLDLQENNRRERVATHARWPPPLGRGEGGRGADHDHGRGLGLEESGTKEEEEEEELEQPYNDGRHRC
jgi:hypothetical protein